MKLAADIFKVWLKYARAQNSSESDKAYPGPFAGDLTVWINTYNKKIGSCKFRRAGGWVRVQIKMPPNVASRSPARTLGAITFLFLASLQISLFFFFLNHGICKWYSRGKYEWIQLSDCQENNAFPVTARPASLAGVAEVANYNTAFRQTRKPVTPRFLLGVTSYESCKNTWHRLFMLVVFFFFSYWNFNKSSDTLVPSHFKRPLSAEPHRRQLVRWCGADIVHLAHLISPLKHLREEIMH